jgi:hypothetical protein
MDVLTVALVLGLIPVALVWWFIARTVRRWGRRFERHPIRTTLALLAIFRRPRPRPLPVRSIARSGDEMWGACPLSTWRGDPRACRWCNGPLEGKPRFCGPTCRHTAEANHYFDKATPAALQRDGFRCQACGLGDGPDHGLEVNHRTPIRGRHHVPGCHHHLEPGPDGRGGLETLGHSCHLRVTAGQRARGWAS